MRLDAQTTAYEVVCAGSKAVSDGLRSDMTHRFGTRVRGRGSLARTKLKRMNFSLDVFISLGLHLFNTRYVQSHPHFHLFNHALFPPFPPFSSPTTSFSKAIT